MATHDTDLVCEKAQIYYFDVLSGLKEDHVPADMLLHINQCDRCSDQIKRLKMAIDKPETEKERLTKQKDAAVMTSLELQYAFVDSPVACGDVKSFLPTLADPLIDIHLPTPITAHIDNCPQCAEDLNVICSLGLSHSQLCRLGQIFTQKSFGKEALSYRSIGIFADEMADKLEAIVCRQNSGVVTVFKIQGFSKGGEKSPVASWSSEVEILTLDEAKAMPRQKLAVRPLNSERVLNFRSFLKPAAAVAAVLLVALMLYIVQPPAAQAIDLDQIYKALAKAANIHIASFTPEESEPTQLQWISRDLGVSILVNGKIVLWDTADRRVKSLDRGTGAVDSLGMNDVMLKGAKEKVDSSFGFIPFKGVSNLPDNAVWKRVKDVSIASAGKNVEVYDLMWMTKGAAGETAFRKWRCFVNVESMLPQKAEWYQKASIDADYQLESYSTVSYLSKDQFNDVIKKFGFVN